MESLRPVLEQLDAVLLGKQQVNRLAVCCLLAGGHLLLEDEPGTGKTTLAEALALSFGLHFHRLHFTSDLLPADLTGIQVFDQSNSCFRFEPGPLFCQVLLADEINRASPRSQSALLEAMASGQVSVEGTTHRLPEPFVVIATQNGLEQVGTSPLPESQLDRFLMRLSLGHPPRDAERALLSGEQRSLSGLNPLLRPEALTEWQRRCQQQHASPALLDYILDLMEASRSGGLGTSSLSARASQALLRAARAWSLLEGRDYVLPDDVQHVFGAVVNHRLSRGSSQDLLMGVRALR